MDAQAGHESSAGATLSALSGINNISGPGMLDYVNTFSLEKLLLDNEICGMAQRLIRGIEPKDDFPAGSIFEELLRDKHLIIAEHTRKHVKGEILLPGSIIDRTNRSRWEEEGEPSLESRIKDQIDRLLSSYEPTGLDEAIVKELEEMMTAEAQTHQLDKLPEHQTQ